MNMFEKILQLNTLFREIRAYKEAHPETACGYYSASYGSLLNAYREGDVGFDECIELLRKVPETETEIKKIGESIDRTIALKQAKQ